MTRSQEFILKNKKKLDDGPAFFNPDTTFMPLEDFEKSKLKFLIIFPTPLETKTVSSTFAALNDYVIEHCPGVFLDCAYMPSGSDIKLYDDAQMPYAIGEITHLDPSHFDVIGFSISVLSEIVTAPVMLKSFERCDKPIPLFWSDRKDLSINECPVIYTGGITEVCGDSMFGEPLPGKIAYMDFQYLGACDKTDVLFKRLIEAKETGIAHRSVRDNDKLGYHHEDPVVFETEVSVKTIQDYTECLFDLDFIYQPQAYKVVFNKDNQIIENTKINPKARDYVTPYYPHEMPEDLGIGRTLINADGSNTGTTQTQVSDGCSAGGQCSFCSEGAYTGGWVEKKRDRILKELWEAKKYSAGYKYKPFSFNCNYITDYKGMLAEFIQIYPKVTFINMRLEELGRDTDALLMMKAIGSNRISAPIEGLSPRVQNNLLNKCLSQEAFDNFMFDLVHLRLTDIKVGGIYTGYETDEDFQWICDYVHKFKEKAKDEGGNLPFRLKMCATRDALTPVNGIGLVRQDYLSENQSVVGYEDATIISTKPMGLSEVYQIETNFGNTIKVTPNHPVLTKWTAKGVKEEHYTKAADLVKGQPIYLRMGTECFGDTQLFELDNKSIPVSAELAQVFGWYMGDGYANIHDNYKTFGMCFSSSEYKIRSSIEKTLTEVGLTPKEHNHGNENVTAFRVHNAEFTRALVREFGHTAFGKKVSDLILRSNRDVQTNFLGYWFAADGTVTNDSRGKYNSRIRLYSVNRQVLLDAQTMLLNMGIISILRGYSTHCGEKKFYTYQLEIKSTSVPKFKELINIPGDKGDKIIVNNTRGSHCIKSNGVVRCYVTSVKRVADEDTFGLEVSNHSYLTNGILSHNTPLVSYPLTACEYIERKSARKSYNGERWLSDEWYEKFKENEIFFKVNGFRYSTFLEQSIVDLGRSLAPMLYKHFVEPLAPIYSLRSVATDEFVAELKSFINPDKFFELRDPEHYISIAHRIHIDLMGSYIPRARRLIRAYRNGNIFDNEMDIRCLKTFDGAKVKCYHNCIKDDPLKIYKDVKMDEDGNLHGECDLLLGCERCQTAEQRKARLARPTPQSKNSDDIIAIPRIPQRQKIRFVLKRLKDYDVLNPNNTSHTFMTKFLQLSDNLLHKYHSIQNHNMFWNADPGLSYYVSGFQIVDTIWQDDVLDEVRSLIPQVNSMLKSVQIVSAKEELREEKIDVNDVNIWFFESELPAEMFTTSSRMYEGEVKVMGSGMQAAVETIIDKSLKAPVFATKGKTFGYFALPCKYNPVLFLSAFLKAKKTSSTQVVQSTTLDCVMTMRETSTVCKHCGKEKAMISVTTGKALPLGPDCICKALLTQRLKA